MINKFLVLTLLVLVGCNGIELQLNSSEAYRTVNGTSKLFVNAGSSNYTLFIQVKTQTGSPTLSVANGNHYYQCHTKNKLALCTIDDLPSETRLDIQVFCLIDCDFTIDVYRSEYYRMQLREEIVTVFDSDDDFILIELQLSQALVATELKIHAFVNNPEEVLGDLILYASTAPNKPSLSNYQYKGEPIWNDGQGIFLQKDKFKPKDKLIIFVAGKKGMEVLITSFGLESNVRRVTVGQSIYDDASVDGGKKYILEINPNLAGVISIKFTKYTGKCIVKISADGSTTSDKFITADPTNSAVQFELSKEVKAELSIQDYCFVEVIAEEHSTFMLRSDLDDETFSMLDDDVTVTGTITAGEVDNYIYKLLAIEEDGNEANIR
jgi:hypothetical protein